MGQAKARKVEIAQLKNSPRKPKLYSAAFFYSPEDTLEKVLAIQFNDRETSLPLNVCEQYVIAEDKLKKMDEIYKADKSCVEHYFKQLDFWLNKVVAMRDADNTTPLSTYEMSQLVIMAQNINWLTLNGFIKQTEYNGTSFTHLA